MRFTARLLLAGLGVCLLNGTARAQDLQTIPNVPEPLPVPLPMSEQISTPSPTSRTAPPSNRRQLSGFGDNAGRLPIGTAQNSQTSSPAAGPPSNSFRSRRNLGSPSPSRSLAPGAAGSGRLMRIQGKMDRLRRLREKRKREAAKQPASQPNPNIKPPAPTTPTPALPTPARRIVQDMAPAESIAKPTPTPPLDPNQPRTKPVALSTVPIAMTATVDRLKLANNLFAQGKIKETLPMYEQLVQVRQSAEDLLWIQYQLAACYRLEGRHKDAVKFYRVVASAEDNYWGSRARWWLDHMTSSQAMVDRQLKLQETLTKLQEQADAIQAN